MSSLFARVFRNLNKGMILEELKSFWDLSTIAKFKQQLPCTFDLSIADIDKIISNMKTPTLRPKLNDPNQYFPLRLITGEKIYSTNNNIYEKNHLLSG